MYDFKSYHASFYANLNDIFHYGVKGMKWGVRRYQDKNGRLTAEGREHYGYGKEKQESDKSALGVYLAFYAGAYAVSAGVIGVAAVASEVKQASKEKKLYDEENNPNQLTRKKVKNVNPKFGKPGYTENCSKCSIVAELVSRGIDDYTAGKGNGLPRGIHTKFFTGAKETKLEVGTKTSLLGAFSKMPNGSSGSYGFSYPNGMGGHSIHWTKLKNGDIRFEDGQTGKSYSIDDFFKEYKPAEAAYSSLIRLDNAKPNYKLLEQYEVLEKKNKKN